MGHVYEQARIPMRDGITLAANVFRPESGEAPTLMIRTPYGVDVTPWAGNGGQVPNLVAFMNAGYGVVWVDCRGTHGSEGSFVPTTSEAEDGYDTLDWLAAQPWCNGSIGMYGPSYTGGTQWAAATTGHPALKAIVPMMTSTDWYRSTVYSPGGAFSPTLSIGWALMMGAADEMRALALGGGDAQRLNEFAHAIGSGTAITEASPVSQHFAAQIPWFGDYLRHDARDEFWTSRSYSESIGSVATPALLIGGWYDFFLRETFADYSRMRIGAATDDARDSTRLIIGPWDHFDLSLNAQFSDRDFGMAGSGAAVDLTGEHLRHFDRWLKGADAAADATPPRVKLFVMGLDQWRDEADWPLPGTDFTSYFLDRGGLTAEQPATDREYAYDYDPANPVRTGKHARLSAPYEAADRRDDRARHDIVLFETDDLDAPVEVTGPVTATLFVSSDARDTDFIVRLIDVFPDGREIDLCHGILRMRYRNGLKRAELLSPSEIYEIEIDMGATANVFLAGHRIRVDVTSSLFPRYDRNTNTGNRIAEEKISDGVVARNTLYTGSAHLSRVVLPIIRGRI